MGDTRIVRIEQGTLESRRPRHAGSNARLGDHGIAIQLSLVRLTDEEGATGFPIEVTPDVVELPPEALELPK